MDTKNFAIGTLSLSALILFLAISFSGEKTAEANFAVKDRDFQAVTARTTRGGDALYITDSRTGLVAVFEYDTAKRRLEPKDLKPLMSAFNNAPAGNRKR